VPAAPQVVQGQLLHRALIPTWLPPLLVAAGIALFFWQRSREEGRQLLIAVTPTRLPVVVGAEARFRAAVTNRANEAVEGQPIAWSVEDTTVATVSDGVVHGRREGVTVVTASTAGRTATAEVQVTRAAVGALAVAPTRLSLQVGEAARVRAMPRDAAGAALESAVMWSSSDPTVATVGGDGRVVAKGPGSATITAQSEAKIATAVVSVAALPTPPAAPTGGAPVGGAAAAGGGPTADCVAYEPAALRIADRKAAGQVVTDGSTDLLVLDNETDARRALALAKRHKAHCFLGRQNTRPNKSDFVIEYWEGASGVATTIDAEDCLALDRPALRIADQGPQGWALADSRRALLFADNRADAQRAWEIAQRHSALCFIGRGNNRPNQRDYLVQYWR
jgi:hypothetical protein